MTQSNLSSSKSHWPGAIAIAAATLILLLTTEPQIGLTWDEPDYIVAAESYTAWFGVLVQDPGTALSREGVDRYWTVNHEHPPVNKIWSGMVWALSRSLLPDLAAHRLGNMLLNSLAAGLLFLLVAGAYGKWTGLAASVALLAMPRVFFHNHLASLDVATSSMIVATLVLFWQTRERESWWIDVALGVVWGLSVATKINAVFVFPTLLLWVLAFDRRWRTFARLGMMGAVAVAVFFCSWPWLYHDSIERTIAYVKWITVDHWKIGQWYMHRFWMPPPWHFPFAITAVVVPPAILALFLLGGGRALVRREERTLGSFLLLNALVPILALASGQSMVYDNDRLFMPAMPFVAALAAIGLHSVVQAVARWLEGLGCGRALSALAIGTLVVLVFAPPLVAMAQLYPHLLSYYSGLVGGVGGATRLGFESTYWCETYTETLAYLNAQAQPGDVVWIDPWSHNVMIYYQLQGRLRDDLRFAGPGEIPSLFDPAIVTVEAEFYEADFVIFQHRQTMFKEQGLDHPIVRWMELHTPELEVRFDSVPLISVYKRKRI
ncbi:MAG: glycosyltransferase family 39 protein [Anaerolineae bacterium]|nr:glycosyltransferase family 39 protein [Anaerolineae bacterium]